MREGGNKGARGEGGGEGGGGRRGGERRREERERRREERREGSELQYVACLVRSGIRMSPIQCNSMHGIWITCGRMRRYGWVHSCTSYVAFYIGFYWRNNCIV